MSRETVTGIVVPTSACCTFSVTPGMASLIVFVERVIATPLTMSRASLPAVSSRCRPTTLTLDAPKLRLAPVVPSATLLSLFADAENESPESPPTSSVS